MKHFLNKRGFTLLELLIVVAIIAVLIALALPYYQDYIEKSKYSGTLADLSNLRKAVQMYEQMESKSLSTFDMRPLIGRYIEDFRKNDLTQTTPRDPYGNDYSFNPMYGIIFSYGPNHIADMNNAAMKARYATGDDIITTFLPPFFLKRAIALDNKEVEVEFSRKVNESTVIPTTFYWHKDQTWTHNGGTAVGAGNGKCGDNAGGSPTVTKISPTVFRFRFDDNNLLTAGSYYCLYISGISSAQGRYMGATECDDRPGLEASSDIGGGTNSGCWREFTMPD
ncbi:MAG: pilin [Candidatus Riflebacteria bacterium]|nr:pilin [Candidatus Riflebacteria bacterium]